MLAVDNGLDAIVVSNHGGRAEDSGRSTIDALPEILEAVGGRIPVLVDSGFRRGTDIAKALALGARAVCIGRPYLWGLGAFGQPGVERVLEPLAAGNARRHDAARRAVPEGSRAGDGAAGLSPSGPSLPCAGPSRTGTRCAARSRRSSSRAGWRWRCRCARRTLRGAMRMCLVSWMLSSRSSASMSSGVTIVGVVVEHPLQALDVADRADGAAAQLAHPLGDDVGHGVDLVACSSSSRW